MGCSCDLYGSLNSYNIVSYVWYHVKNHHHNMLQHATLTPGQHSPAMSISAASSEISLPHKNRRRYKTSATAPSTVKSTITIFSTPKYYNSQRPWLFFVNYFFSLSLFRLATPKNTNQLCNNWHPLPATLTHDSSPPLSC